MSVNVIEDPLERTVPLHEAWKQEQPLTEQAQVTEEVNQDLKIDEATELRGPHNDLSEPIESLQNPTMPDADDMDQSPEKLETDQPAEEEVAL